METHKLFKEDNDHARIIRKIRFRSSFNVFVAVITAFKFPSVLIYHVETSYSFRNIGILLF